MLNSDEELCFGFPGSQDTPPPTHWAVEEHSLHRAVFCPVHEDHPAEFYCETCRTMVCRECVLHEHESHSYKLPVGRLVVDERKHVSDQIKELYRLCEKLQTHYRDLTRWVRELDQEALTRGIGELCLF